MKDIPDFKNSIIAHRGIHDNIKIPENSIPAFKKAVEMSIPIELDVQLTKDDQLVVFHDYNLNRMTGSNVFIQDLTYEEISKFTLLNTNEKIPTLGEVLALINGKVLLDIEIKNTNRVHELGKILSTQLDGYSGDLLLKSFHPKIINWFKKNKNKYPLGLLISDTYGNKVYNYLSTSKMFINYCNPDFLAISKKIIKKKKIQDYHKKYPLLIWTIKNSEELADYQEYGDAYICNNLPYDWK